MPREDVTIAQGTDHRTGFSTAVRRFCQATDGKTVKAGDYLSMATEVFLNGGKDPKVYGVVGFVSCKLTSTQKSKFITKIYLQLKSTTRKAVTIASLVSPPVPEQDCTLPFLT